MWTFSTFSFGSIFIQQCNLCALIKNWHFFELFPLLECSSGFYSTKDMKSFLSNTFGIYRHELFWKNKPKYIFFHDLFFDALFSSFKTNELSFVLLFSSVQSWYTNHALFIKIYFHNIWIKHVISFYWKKDTKTKFTYS